MFSLNVTLEKILFHVVIQCMCCLFVQVICKVSRGTVEDVNRAVEAAKVCFPRFSTIFCGQNQKELLFKFGKPCSPGHGHTCRYLEICMKYLEDILL